MSDLHHWRHVQFHSRIEWAHPDSHEKSVQAFDESPLWERVHVLTDDELAAHDAQVRAEAGRARQTCGETATGDDLPPGFQGEYRCERSHGHEHHQSGNLAWPAEGERTLVEKVRELHRPYEAPQLNGSGSLTGVRDECVTCETNWPCQTIRALTEAERTLPSVEHACEVMHDAYEAAAVAAGWETQERSRKQWAEVPEANKVTMRVAVSAVLALLATAPTVEQVRQEERERIAAAIRAAGAQIESAQREVHRGYLPILEGGIVAGYSQAARIAEQGGA